MPSDLNRAPESAPAPAAPDVGEPPSVKLIVRLFVIPLIIVAVAVGIMTLISLIAGSGVSMDEAVSRLKNPGGARTADWLVGPGAKQRYLDAKALVDHMKSSQLTEAQRIKLSNDLIEILDNHTRAEEGEVQHFVLLALARTWQRNPADAETIAPESSAARAQAVQALLRYADAPQLPTRKAAVLATVYLAGQPEAATAIPMLVGKLTSSSEDLDVRIAAATALGPLGRPDDRTVVDALQTTLRDTDPRNLELVWSSALSLAQIGQEDVADTILLLLSREELANVKVYDRETDPKNPAFRALSEQEIERILINTMLGAHKLDSTQVKAQIRALAETDRSARVRASGKQIVHGGGLDEPTR